MSIDVWDTMHGVNDDDKIFFNRRCVAITLIFCLLERAVEDKNVVKGGLVLWSIALLLYSMFILE